MNGYGEEREFSQFVNLRGIKVPSHYQCPLNGALMFTGQDGIGSNQHRPLGKYNGASITAFCVSVSNQEIMFGQICGNTRWEGYLLFILQVKCLAKGDLPRRVNIKHQVQSQLSERAIGEVRPDVTFIGLSNKGIGVIPGSPVRGSGLKVGQPL